jgi:folate-binding protein YgfZ
MRPQPLLDELLRRGAVLDGGAPHRVLRFGDPAAEARAAFDGGVVREQPARALVAVSGKDRAEFVNRMSTNDARRIEAGRGIAAVLPTAKGRIVDLVRAFARGEAIVLLGSDGNGPPLKNWLEKYVVMEELTLADLSGAETSLLLLGPRASEVVRTVLGVTLPNASAGSAVASGGFAVAHADFAGASVTLLGSGEPPLHGIELVAPAAVADRLFAKLCDAGLAPIGEEAFAQVRVELGIPLFGRELTENVNPLEASLLSAISFEKGCYIGQEVVARLNNYSKVQRRLVGAKFPASVDPAHVNEIFWDLLRVGHATSATRSPRLDATLALAFVKTEYARPGTPIYTVVGGEQLHGTLADVPFQ